MAVENGWGQGAVNNSNDYGKAKANSTNGFGKIYESTNAGLTNIVGGDPVVSISYAFNSFCADASDPTPTVSNNAGAGAFSSTTGLVINSTTGVIDIDASTASTYTVTYTDTDAATAIFDLTIHALPTVTVSVSAGTICVGESTTITASGASSYSWSNGSTGNSITVSPTTTTTFTATGTDSNGCVSSGATTITVNALPTVEISGTLTYCAGSTTTLTATAGLSSYLWSTGATTQAINVTAGSYTVTGTDSNGCSATSAASAVTELPLDSATVSYSASAYCQMPTGALAVEGYYPLYSTASAANAVSSDGTNHTHTLGGVTYYMPNAGVIAYHGTYSLTTPAPTITGQSGTFTAAEKFFPFQMQFDTSGGKTITIPGTVGSSFTVDWGDGNTTTETGGTISHTYASGIATSTVSLGAESDSGPLVRMLFSGGGSASDLLAVTQWGDIAFNYLYGMFQGCNNSNFTISATDTPDFSNATAADYMFYNATNVSGNFNNFTMGNIRQFLALFRGATNFNEDISNWDVSSVTNMGAMFFGASNFNQDISSWNTGNVTNLLSAFINASSFNQNINSWDTSKVTTMNQCFYGCTNFNQNLSDWDISSLTTALYMFGATTNLSTENYTDTVVGWAVFVYNNSGSPSSVQWTGTTPSFDGTRTSDLASGQTYAAKYGSNWTATGWTDSQDAFDYLTTTLSWTIN